MTAADPVSVGLDEAARLTDLSRSTIDRAIKAGELTAHYPTRRPSILVSDLRAWIEAAPTERAG